MSDETQKHDWKVIVGTKTIWSGTDSDEAYRQFDTAVKHCTQQFGYKGDETVTLTRDGEIYEEWEQ